MQLVTPSEVAMAVSMAARVWMINFQVSLFFMAKIFKVCNFKFVILWMNEFTADTLCYFSYCKDSAIIP